MLISMERPALTNDLDGSDRTFIKKSYSMLQSISTSLRSEIMSMRSHFPPHNLTGIYSSLHKARLAATIGSEKRENIG
jgi:hypothetical protein